jgi:hypothetical protein
MLCQQLARYHNGIVGGTTSMLAKKAASEKAAFLLPFIMMLLIYKWHYWDVHRPLFSLPMAAVPTLILQRLLGKAASLDKVDLVLLFAG